MDQQTEKDKTERVTGLGRKTREEIAKWNQMTALRFQTGGRQTSPASLRGSFEGGDVKGSIIRRRAQRPKRDKDLDKVSQVPRGSASNNLIAETQDVLYLILCSMGSQCNCFKRGLACSALQDLGMSLAAKKKEKYV